MNINILDLLPYIVSIGTAYLGYRQAIKNSENQIEALKVKYEQDLKIMENNHIQEIETLEKKLELKIKEDEQNLASDILKDVILNPNKLNNLTDVIKGINELEKIVTK